MTQDNSGYGDERVAIAEDRGHTCNYYCRPDGVHAHVLYATQPLPTDTVAVISSGVRCEVVEFREAPEVPPVDPTAPQHGEYPYRYLVWSRP